MEKIDYTVRVVDNPMYNRWAKLKQRAVAQGKYFSQSWLEDFLQFLADVGEPPVPGARLGLIIPDAGYRPGNVRWMQPSRPTPPPKRWASPVKPQQPRKPPVHYFNWAGWTLVFKKGSTD